MLCERCGKNEATVHAVRTINGITKEEHICGECAAKAGMFDKAGLLGSMFHFPANHNKVCSNCGNTLEDFNRTGLLGCSECYKEFEAELLPVLRRMHGNSKHVGAVPVKDNIPEISEREQRLNELKQKLADAIKTEDFENAAIFRDEINAIKAGGSENG